MSGASIFRGASPPSLAGKLRLASAFRRVQQAAQFAGAVRVGRGGVELLFPHGVGFQQTALRREVVLTHAAAQEHGYSGAVVISRFR